MTPRLHLLTATPAEGQTLAIQLARELLTALPTSRSAADHLRTGATPPSLELTTAIYFHAISLANQGWNPDRSR